MIAWLSQHRSPWIKNIAIGVFRMLYRIKRKDYVSLRSKDFQSFGEFFARPIDPRARPLPQASSVVVSPCDGRLVDHCKIATDATTVIKGVKMQVSELLGEPLHPSFTNGTCTVHYLAPNDYHRVHMPYTGELTDITWIDGQLATVKPGPKVAKTYLRNERVVLHFTTLQGPMVLVFVGARNVGNIVINDIGIIRGQQSPHRWHFDRPKTYQRGEEIGRFLLGSTVIFLWPKTMSRHYRLKTSIYIDQHLKVMSELLAPNI
ncbi:MAG: phosphatidylserine decarboxylase [Gammaproteobacteria bacterium]|nr:phosphatidylserine decarboxylase [Gammaproteobacteria bacterium]